MRVDRGWREELTCMFVCVIEEVIMCVCMGFDGFVAAIAQWLEHWSSKPGVGSSILPGGTGFWNIIS